MPTATVDITRGEGRDGMDASVQTLDHYQGDPADPVRRLSPEQHFRLRVARNDLDRAHELDLAGAPPFEVAQAAGALRCSLFNALQIIDDVTGEQL